MRAKLLITLNNSLVSEYVLDSEITHIGRKSENEIVIDNLAVSGKHARILFMGGEAFLEDLGSTNGTFVNGERITKHLLKSGERITIGQHQLKYEGGSADEDFEKTVVISRPYAVGLEGTAAFQSAAKEKEAQQKEVPAAKSPADGERPALLQLLSGPNNGKKMALNQSITRLGKPGEQVAAIAKRPQGYFIMHLGGNTPQPLLNGASVGTQATALKQGDIIEVGKVRMKILIPT